MLDTSNTSSFSTQQLGEVQTAHDLMEVFADTYHTMYFSQVAHWNVRGIDFPQYHALFEESYKLCSEALDPIAEVLAARYNSNMPSSLQDVIAKTAPVFGVDTTDARSFVHHLVMCHRSIISMWEKIANTQGLFASTGDLAASQSRSHTQMEWKLRSCLQ